MNRKKLTINYQPIEWLGDKVRILDQTRLPSEEVYLETSDYKEIASAIRELKVRGAPLIGVAGAYGLALGGLQIYARSSAELLHKLHDVALVLIGTRPTARNLFWAIERMERAAKEGKSIPGILDILVKEAIKIHTEEADATLKLSQFGAELIKDGATILTHCNTGPLATTGYGTALGIIIYAHQQGKKVKVFADETRPLLQGARLTTWELKKAGIPVTLITDSMAGYFMKQGKIDCAIVGADRIAANGDTANKIGTYSVAVLAKENGIPFYVAAPTSTIDLSLTDGNQIPIEKRGSDEITRIRGVQIAPDGVATANPTFDVTPNEYITAIITEKGIIRKPFGMGMKILEGEVNAKLT
ncbi:MAG: S-methyl-5-thioribose-1-phosphate isomerase [Dehalococcoidales bacterium]|nr:S-methyl-5-thioribose-1-phosphate isomerase [Dehalococcoidales bacterium]